MKEYARCKRKEICYINTCILSYTKAKWACRFIVQELCNKDPCATLGLVIILNCYCCRLFVLHFKEAKMAHGITNPKNKKEHFDSSADLHDKLDQLTQLIQESKHFIVFTGKFVYVVSSLLV